MKLDFTHDDIRNGLYVPTFRPIIDLSSRDIVGLEAMGNLEIDEKVIPSGAFADYANSMNLSWFVDMKTLEVAGRAFNAIRRNFQEAYDIQLHVNLTTTYLDKPDLVHDSINSTLVSLAQNGEGFLSPRDITLEVSNDYTVQNFTVFREALHEFKRNGYTIIMEDYEDTGLGMAYLRDNLYLDGFKLNESFIFGARDDSKRLEKLNHLAETAEKEELRLIANGIHTADERHLLDKCAAIPYGQGRFEDIGGEIPPHMVEYKMALLRATKEQEKKNRKTQDGFNLSLS